MTCAECGFPLTDDLIIKTITEKDRLEKKVERLSRAVTVLARTIERAGLTEGKTMSQKPDPDTWLIPEDVDVPQASRNVASYYDDSTIQGIIDHEAELERTGEGKKTGKKRRKSKK